MSQAAADMLREIMRETLAENQAGLPEEDRAAFDEPMCMRASDGYKCTKKLGHEKPEHAAHGMTGEIIARWEA